MAFYLGIDIGTSASKGVLIDDRCNIVCQASCGHETDNPRDGWYQHDAERIKARFPVRKIKTSKDIEDWNAGKISAAIIHPASAGHGLNLQQGGSILIWFGLTWSLELYQQTNARLWRQGQADKTVIIQHIVAKDTIDERILNVLKHKDGTQAALIEAVKADLGMTETENGGIL